MLGDNINHHAAPASAREGSKGVGSLVCFESELFRREPELFQRTRRNYLIREFIRALELQSVVLISHEDRPYNLVDIDRLKKAAERLPGLQQKDRKKFLADVREFRTLTSTRKTQCLQKLLGSYSESQIFGWSYKDFQVHYVQDFPRLKHVFGLADAVSTALENYNLRVLFPAITSIGRDISAPIPARAQRVTTYVDDSKGYPRLRLRVTRKKLLDRDVMFRLVLHYLRVFPKGLLEKDYVKRIKLSLAGTFSYQMGQDVPEGFGTFSFPLFPPSTQANIDKQLSHRKKKRVQFYFNLLQSKALCAPVDEMMIAEAYAKHKASLCRPKEETIPVDLELYQKLKDYGRRVGSEMRFLYDPYTTSLPNGMASINNGRATGGNRQALANNGTLIRSSGDPVLDLTGGENPRVEPFVIGLFGPPASGKTTALQHIVRDLRQRLCPGMSRENFCYSRSCNTKHWDGYNGQPVVVMDDFGQDLKDNSDIAEFMTLVSLNDYVLPMAELGEKGTKFTSPIVIVTSNMGFGTPVVKGGSSENLIEEPLALWRRFTLPLLVERNRGRTLFRRLHLTEFDKQIEQHYQKHNLGKIHLTSSVLNSGISKVKARVEADKLPLPSVTQLCEKTLRERCDYHIRTFHNCWTQFIGSYFVRFSKEDGAMWHVQVEEDPTQVHPHTQHLRLEFPRDPPDQAPRVKAHAIPEPLKVRMITIAEEDTKCLQPLQKALWTYLGTCPQFCLTNGVKELDDFESETLPWFERIESKIKSILSWTNNDDLWLSGDYTAATDNFPMWATEALTEGILEHIDHEPTKAWVRWEISPHSMIYRENGKEVCETQTSGQLMGSLLSFPLLCFLNDFVVSESGFEAHKYLVNGDDVVARGSMENIQRWKKLAPRVGLSLSVGKNFIDPDFCTVNSQLFFGGEGLATGKVSCQKRTNATISYCLAETQYYWGLHDRIKESFLSRNWRELSRTPRSIHVGRSHGGLGLVDTFSHLPVDVSLAKRVYLYDVLRRFSKPLHVSQHPYSFVTYPIVISDRLTPSEGELPTMRDTVNKCQELGAFTPGSMARLEEAFADLTHAQLREFNTSLGLRGASFLPFKQKYDRMYKEGSFKLEDAPPLDMFKNVGYWAVDSKIAEMVQNRVLANTIDVLMGLWTDKSLQSDPFLVEYPEFEELEDISFLMEEIQHFSLDEVLLFEDPIIDDGFYKSARRMDCRFWRQREEFLSVQRPVDVRTKGVDLCPLFQDDAISTKTAIHEVQPSADEPGLTGPNLPDENK